MDNINHFCILVSSDIANKINNNNNDIKSISTINPATLDYERNNLIYGFLDIKNALFVYNYIKEKGKKRVSIIVIKANEVIAEQLCCNINEEIINYILISKLNNFQYKVLDTKDIEKYNSNNKSSNNIPSNETKFNIQQVNNKHNNMYNFFIHIPRWLWFILGFDINNQARRIEP